MITDSSPAQAAERLLLEGRANEALTLIEPVAKRGGATHSDLHVHAGVLKALGRIDEAIEVNRRALRENPKSAVAEHNLAASLGDIDGWIEAEAACRRAFAKGGDQPETWLVLGRALMHQKRLDEAEAAMREAVKRRPTFADAQRDLAQLIWMSTGDRDAAEASLREAHEAHPEASEITVQLAKALQYGGREEEAYGTLSDAITRSPASDFMLEMAASNLAIVSGKAQAALDHAIAAIRAKPGDIAAGINACDGYLGLGQADRAAELALRLYQSAPLEQQVIARLATAWRLTGDPRYRTLYDYDGLVRPYVIDTPSGWSSLETYLVELADALKRLHAFETHPFDQSLRGGSQTSQDLTRTTEPAVNAFFEAIDGPIRRYMRDVGPGEDILRRRNTGEYAFNGIWSVMLRPNGFHIDHTHPAGWLSSACYIELPEAVQAGGREGWIKFGEPGIPTAPPLEAEHFVQPHPGLLVLFPSYMWHGTVPFSGERNRLTIAFDVIPQAAG
jgi:tetratricopeptide (TPR) repeat protein